MSYVCILAGTPLALGVSLLLRRKVFLPLLTVLVVYLPFLWETQKSLLHGMRLVVFWVMVQSALVLFFSYIRPEQMGNAIWRGKTYTESMFQWIRSGILPEGSAASVIRFHLRQAALYCGLAFLTANFASLALGSALLNYMNYYVARLALESRQKSIAFILGWNPWSVVRVLAFLWLGTILGLPLLTSLFPVRVSWSLWYLIPGLIGVIFDLTIKVLLSGAWSALLRQNLKVS